MNSSTTRNTPVHGRVTLSEVYQRLTGDQRHFDQRIWQVPAILIVTNIVFYAQLRDFATLLGGLERWAVTISLGLFDVSLIYALCKHRMFSLHRALLANYLESCALNDKAFGDQPFRDLDEASLKKQVESTGFAYDGQAAQKQIRCWKRYNRSWIRYRIEVATSGSTWRVNAFVIILLSSVVVSLLVCGRAAFPADPPAPATTTKPSSDAQGQPAPGAQPSQKGSAPGGALATVHAVIGSLGLVVAGVWTYLGSVARREKCPQVKVTHNVMHRAMPEGKTLLRVTVDVANQGNVLLGNVSGFVRVQQMVPWDTAVLQKLKDGGDPVDPGQTEVVWPLLAERPLTLPDATFEIEPRETDQFHIDFVLDCEIQTVAVYSRVENEKKRGRKMGWNATSVYDLDHDRGDNNDSSKASPP